MEKRGTIVFILVMILLVAGLFVLTQKSSIQGRAVLTAKAVDNIEKEVAGYKIGAEEVAGNQGGLSRTTIAVDSLNQPHIVADWGDHQVYAQNKINGQWSESLFATHSSLPYDVGRIYLPHIEIDSQDRAWISAWVPFASTKGGQVVWVMDNVATSSSKRHIGIFNRGTANGNVAVNPKDVGNAVVMEGDGKWVKINSNGQELASGKLFEGSRVGGEKIRFKISDGGVFHAAFGGYSKYASGYKNSNMGSMQTWASYSRYSEQGDDLFHPSLGVDAENPNMAYIVIRYNPGVVINVWDGNDFIYPDYNLKVVDPNPFGTLSTRLHGGNGISRFAPQWAPVPGGGSYLCWTGGDSNVKLTYVSQKGVVGEIVTVGPGGNCAMDVDSNGDIHMAYVVDGAFQGKMRYRKIESPYGCDEGDVQFENTPCIASKMWDQAHKWKIDAKGVCRYGTRYQKCEGSRFVWQECEAAVAVNERCNGMDDDCDGMIDEGCDDDQDGYVDATMACGAGSYKFDFGWSQAVPVSGDFDGDGKDDKAVYCGNCGENEEDWWIRYSSNNSIAILDWGSEVTLPSPGDFDGDGIEDLGAFNPENGKWSIRKSTGGYKEELFGWQEVLPASGDFDGDGKDDISVYYPLEGKWSIIKSRTGDVIEELFGFQGTLPASGDFDGDGKDDLVVYYNGKWYISQSKEGHKEVDFGWHETLPIAGDFDGDGKEDISVFYPEAAIWYVKPSDWKAIVQCRKEDGTLNENCFGCIELDLNDNNADITTSYPCVSDADCVDDGNPCTDDRCIDNMCDYAANTNDCDDGLYCTINDVCSDKVCSGVSRICEDDNLACTIPYCEETQDKCLFDLEMCTCELDDECPDDNNICTDERCVGGLCEQIGNTNPCNDNDLCTDNDRCNSGFCVGTRKDIDDGDPTTYDTCVDGVVRHEEFEAGRVYDFSYEYEDIYGVTEEDIIVSNQTQSAEEEGPEGVSYIWIGLIIIIIFGIIIFFILKRKNKRSKK